jgi:hypothetical protein
MERKLIPLLIAVWLVCVIVANRKVIAAIAFSYSLIKVA